MGDHSRPVTGYPAAPPPPPTSQNPNGYPYPYPPPPPHHQPPYHPNYPSYDPSTAAAARATFLRRFFTAIIAFFIICGSIVFIIWLVLRPRVPQFRVDSLSLSNFNASTASQSISGNWVVGLSVYNPNKKLSLAYDGVVSSIFYKDEFLAQTRIPPLKQGKRNRTAVSASFSATNSFVGDRSLSSISRDNARGTVSFDVRILGRVVFRTGGWTMRRRIFRVLCEDLAVAISNSGGGGRSSGKLVGGGRDCRVGV
ncbi:uncharacterized protein At1g08160 [Ziziphus jujuba]|uniref:Uncharacterized protein At1g08160 n=1 Tax=Ziziphus jujuba TaxID=326968 RepID=A0A6P3Z6M6_ZIZJJ|nr:uncharacterized protein At1g08160 [Ziziphus jujuba]